MFKSKLRPLRYSMWELSPAQGDVQSGGPGGRGAGGPGGVPHQGVHAEDGQEHPGQGGVHQQEEDAVDRKGRESTPSGHQPRL